VATRLLCFVVAAALTIAARTVVFAAQTITTVHASPSVELTIATIDGRLGLLVFWRGQPGWTLTRAGVPPSLLQSGVPLSYSSGSWSDGALNVSLRRGPFSLGLSYDVLRQRIDLRNQWLKLPHGTNIVLLDDVDQTRGPRVVGLLGMDPGALNLDPRRGTLGPLLGRIPEMKAFLRCDAPIGDPQFAPDTPASVRELTLRRMRGYCDDLQ
jgi:hypothetical protein